MTFELAPLEPGLVAHVAGHSSQLETRAEIREIRWMSPVAGLWVASRRGEHAGMVERIDGIYRARNSRGREVGKFDDLDAARAAVEGNDEDRGNSRRFRLLLGGMIALNGAIAGVLAGLAVLLLR
ncbi:MAG: hypothetical protein ABIR17_05930 [Pseudolysinimonas sp.]|uniref:hypothetical protein n=1 Tax=Pseudolysinimonas sp. TaxID=2680009 RepID=UPI00326476FA